MKERYYAGFMSKQPAWMRSLPMLRRRLFAYVVDLIAIAYLTTVISFCVNAIAYDFKDFVLLPWWILLVLSVEAAALWESFGVSPGMKLLGIRLVDVSRQSRGSAIIRRTVRFLLWHISALPLIGFLFASEDGRRALHERVSHMRMADADELDRDLRPWYRRGWFLSILALAIATLLASALYTEVDFYAFFTGASRTGKWWAALLTPDWSIFVKGFRYLIVTIFTAFLATAFAVAVAVPLSFFAARNLATGVGRRLAYTIIRAVLSVVRSIEPIVWGIIFIVWVKVGAFPGILALFVHSVADLTKLYSERLESIDYGPVEAIQATGARRTHVILYGIVPQIINPYLSFTIYRWDINVRMATVIGLIGVPVIGQLLYQYTQLYRFRQVGMLMLLILATVWIMDYLSGRLRARLE